jgi:hypothetical protein
MPSGYLIDESASWTVIVVGEMAGYPNSSNMALGMRLKDRSGEPERGE